MSMMSTGIVWSLTLAAAFAQNAPRIAPIPADPLELATGQIQIANTPPSRDAALRLLARARNQYRLRMAGRGYDLKAAFTVNSGGQTYYDGAWEMEDFYAPKQGLHWTAKAAAGYTTTQVSSSAGFYGEGTMNTIPLRLHEARAALFDPIPAPANVAHQSIRISQGNFNGVPVTCLLLAGSQAPAASTAAPGRRWEETEECIDPQTGLLQVHSQVPGRYAAYDYSNGPQLADHTLPRKVTITEAGKIVSEISVESLTELPATVDDRFFAPTEAMKARGQSVAMSGTQKIWRFSRPGPFPSGATAQPVCVFGLVNAAGQLVEAHSLQPSDPNSAAAVEAAKHMNFSVPAKAGARPQQHFVFVIEKFVSGE